MIFITEKLNKMNKVERNTFNLPLLRLIYLANFSFRSFGWTPFLGKNQRTDVCTQELTTSGKMSNVPAGSMLPFFQTQVGIRFHVNDFDNSQAQIFYKILRNIASHFIHFKLSSRFCA